MRLARLLISGAILCALLCSGCSGPPPSYTVNESATAEFPAGEDGASWRRWGGPAGNFQVAASGLADSWPAEGPPLLWSRKLGGGYSAIAAHRGALFTMYRDGEQEVVIALRADDGATVWGHHYPAPTREPNATRFGSGPNAMPLVLEDRVVTLGYTGVLSCLDLVSGELLWSHELIDELGGEILEFGYSASPIEHDGNVVVLVGGEQQGAVAFSPVDGSIVWRGTPSSVSYATPIVIDLDGQEQLVYFSADEIIGLRAADGERLWSFPVVNQYRNNATGPLWGDDGLLWVATQLDGGTRALRLTRAGDATSVEEVWTSNQLSIHYWNALRLGNHVYASIGSNATVMAAVDIRTGEIAWRERGFEQANFVHAGEHSVLLDANGHLALVALRPEGLEVKAEARILDGPTWTVPTLAGRFLYVRDKQSILALDLGAGS